MCEADILCCISDAEDFAFLITATEEALAGGNTSSQCSAADDSIMVEPMLSKRI
jgi:hypothetical protein